MAHSAPSTTTVQLAPSRAARPSISSLTIQSSTARLTTAFTTRVENSRTCTAPPGATAKVVGFVETSASSCTHDTAPSSQPQAIFRGDSGDANVFRGSVVFATSVPLDSGDANVFASSAPLGDDALAVDDAFVFASSAPLGDDAFAVDDALDTNVALDIVCA